jgi:hypothetical protein
MTAIEWVNESFVLMYGLRDRHTALGNRFEAVYEAAWAQEPPEAADGYRIGRQALKDHLRFAGVPSSCRCRATASAA